MRLIALLPALCCTVALILSFLCLFAGHKKDFMEDYHILTLNTSRLGEGLTNETLSGSSSISSLLNSLSDNAKDNIGEIASAVMEKLGIEDFYSAHLLDYCFGQYTPAEAPNATVSASDIHKNVTGCSNQTAMFWFNPNEILEKALNNSGVNVTLSDLKWPDNIQKGLNALRLVSVTAFVLYCISIGLIFLSLIAALIAFLSAGRLAACLNFMVGALAFLAIGLASALVTAIIVKGGDIINKYGNDIGVEANKGSKFMAITWAATALMFITLVAWSFETCCGHRRKQALMPPKHG